MRPRSLILASSFAALAAVFAACATGSDGNGRGDDDDDDGSPTGTGGSGATGGEAAKVGGAASSSASVGGSPSTGGTGGEPPMCAEDPCKLLPPQCGCEADQMCVIDSATAENPNGRECTAAGTTAPGQPCAGNSDCAPGSMCVNTGVNLCMAFCSSNATCNAPGGVCVITLVDGSQQPVPDATLCSLNCDPITNSGCNAGGCAIGQDPSLQTFTLCQGVGAGVQGASCVDSGDCAGGYGCFNADPQCLKYCGYNPTKGVCPGVTVCVPFETPLILGNQEYGACI